MTDSSIDDRSPSPASGERVSPVASELLADLARLFRAEGNIMRAEFDDHVVVLRRSLAKLAVGTIVGVVAVGLVAHAFVTALAGIFGQLAVGAGSMGWASLVVGLLLGIAGALVLKSGIDDLGPAAMFPETSVEPRSLRRN